MPFQIVSTNTLSLAHGIKTLISGDAGAGKTVLCASAPSPLIISAESGLLSLRKFNIPAININTYNDLIEVYNWCIKSNETKQFGTYCLDSVSEIAEVVLAAEKIKNKDPRKSYGEMQTQMTNLLRSFRDISGKHVVFTAKRGYTVDGNTGGKHWAPLMPGQGLSQSLPYFFDEVWSLQIFRDPQTGVKSRWLQTQPTNTEVAKDRSGTLAEFEDANQGLTIIFNKMLAS